MVGLITGLMLGAAGYALLSQWLQNKLGDRDFETIEERDLLSGLVHSDSPGAHTGIDLPDPPPAKFQQVSPDGMHRFRNGAGLASGSCVFCGESVETAGPQCGHVSSNDLTFLSWPDRYEEHSDDSN